jgi:hypothetical protein
MPEFTVKQVHLPELHLPEIKRDEIVRALSGVRVPDVDLARAQRRPWGPGLDLSASPWRRRRLSGTDVGKLVAAAVTAARFVRPAGPRSRWAPLPRSRRSLVAIIRPAPRRSRRRFALLAIAIAMLAGWAVLRNPASRSRIDRAVSDARRRFDGMRARPSDGIDHEAGEPAPATTSDVAPAGGDGTAAAMDPIDAGSTAAAANPA